MSMQLEEVYHAFRGSVMIVPVGRIASSFDWGWIFHDLQG